MELSALVEEIGHRLARTGLRWTPGRRVVVEIFEAAAAPLSMQELQDRAVERRVPLSSRPGGAPAFDHDAANRAVDGIPGPCRIAPIAQGTAHSRPNRSEPAALGN